MDTQPQQPATLHRIYGEPTPWNRPEAYRPDQVLRESIEERRTLAADWREFWNEVAEAPAHHAAFAILILVSVALLFVAPLIVVGWVK